MSEIDPNEETELDFWKNKCEEINEMSEARDKAIGKMNTQIDKLTFENRELKAKVEILENVKGTLNYVIEYQKRKIHALEYLFENIKETIQEFEEEEENTEMDCAEFNEKEFIYGKLRTCKNCNKWELAE